MNSIKSIVKDILNESSNGFYVIYSNDIGIKVIKTLYATYDEAWQVANDMYESGDYGFEHYDVVGSFKTKKAAMKQIKDMKEIAAKY